MPWAFERSKMDDGSLLGGSCIPRADEVLMRSWGGSRDLGALDS